MLHKEYDIFTLVNFIKDPKSSSKFTIKFMDNTLKYLTLVKPERNKNGLFSASSILDQILNSGSQYVTSEMGNVPTIFIEKLFELYYKVPRSSLVSVPGGFTKNTRYSGAVPWVLYAFKYQYDIKYSDWDFSDPHIGVLLGHALKDYIKFRVTYKNIFKKPLPPPGWAPNSWLEKYGEEVPYEGGYEEWLPEWKAPIYNPKLVRLQYLTHGVTGEPLSESAWAKGTFTCSPVLMKIRETFYIHMLTQTWIFAPQHRNENMIMSLEDVDLMPDPIDESVITMEKPLELNWH